MAVIRQHSLLAKSDQLNAADLPSPTRFIIDAVAYNPQSDRPVRIHLQGLQGHPYIPCKGMLRGIVGALGNETDSWVGVTIELYCEPSVRWAGKPVGGIEVLGFSSLKEPFTYSRRKSRTQVVKTTFNPIPALDNSSVNNDSHTITWYSEKIKQAVSVGEIQDLLKRAKQSNPSYLEKLVPLATERKGDLNV